MTKDLEILQALYLPFLEDIAKHAPPQADSLAQGADFWAYFNRLILDKDTDQKQLSAFLALHQVTDIADHLTQLTALKSEYLSHLAALYCSGHTNASVAQLLADGYMPFVEEVTFQKDMLAAIRTSGRAQLREDLRNSVGAPGVDISDEEMARAFQTLAKDEERRDLRNKIAQWDEQPVAQPVQEKKRRRIPLPFLFLQFAAAAAVITVVSVGVIKLGHYGHEAPTSYGQTPVDTANVPPHDTAAPYNGSTGAVSMTSTDSTSDTAKVQAHAPRIILKGTIIDSATGKMITGVKVIMKDDRGTTRTVFSKDGTFRFQLPLLRDLVITGQKDHYISARLSLSTKGVSKTDADDVIDITLRLSKDEPAEEHN